jgi:hypothetical protein
VAAAATNNTVGVAGVGWKCLILPVRVTDEMVMRALSWKLDGEKTVPEMLLFITTFVVTKGSFGGSYLGEFYYYF